METLVDLLYYLHVRGNSSSRLARLFSLHRGLCPLLDVFRIS